MTEEEKAKLITAWFNAQSAGSKNYIYEENWWAVETLINLPETDPETAWEIITRIEEMENSEIVFPILSAGPLEHLLSLHGEKFIERVESRASHNLTFKKLMQGVIITSEDTPVWKRFYQIAGIPPPIDDQYT